MSTYYVPTYVDQKENCSIHLGGLWPQNFYETFKVHLTTMMQYSSTQASKKGGQMLEHWGHLCQTYEGAGAANLYFDRKSWMEHFNSHPEIYCILPKNTFLKKGEYFSQKGETDIKFTT